MSDLFYTIRHLKAFKKLSGNDNKGIWCISWQGGDEEPLIYNNRDKTICFHVPDIHLAEYIVSLHNSSDNLIEEVEKKNEHR